MKKLTLSVGLLIGVVSMNAQDTTCTYFTGKNVLEFKINIKYGDVLCLDLSDKRKRTRKVITEYFDGSTREHILDSKDRVYYSPLGAVKVYVGRPRFFNKL